MLSLCSENCIETLGEYFNFSFLRTKKQRLKEMAQQQNISINKLLDKTIAALFAQYGACTRFLARVLLCKNKTGQGLA